MKWPAFPSVYEINTWIWLHELSRKFGEEITLGNVPDEELRRLAERGFDALWLMGVWQRSPRARHEARACAGLLHECKKILPDFQPEDLVGSPYAILDYRVDGALGGDGHLARFRERLHRLGMRLILDFIPNHLARDHAWVRDHPERFVSGGEGDGPHGDAGSFHTTEGAWFAHGRDPNLAPWTDTVQLDLRRQQTRRAITDCLLSVAERCDGVRCDMAMLVARDVFLFTWGGAFEGPENEFWPEAIREVKAAHPGFLLLAEAYWGLEPELQRMGFDYVYDKGLYDRLLSAHAVDVRIRLLRSMARQSRLARFVENHDERRCIKVFGGKARSRAVALLALTLPGMRLFHEGQAEGNRIRIPVQLGRRPHEEPDPELTRFYGRLVAALRAPVFHEGEWRLLLPRPAGPDSVGHESVIAHQWMLGEEYRLVVVNLSARGAQCRLQLETLAAGGGKQPRLVDLLGGAAPPACAGMKPPFILPFELKGHGCHLWKLEHAG